MSKFSAFLSSKTFFANVALAVLALLLLIFLVNMLLRVVTHHGDAIAVPNISGLSLEEAQRVLAENDLEFKVLDSAVFNADLPLGSVVNQFPLAGAQVKEGRVVLLTINPFVVAKVEVPNVLDKTMRRAVYDLQSKGFLVGELIYKPDIAKDAVLGLEINGQLIMPGEKFEKGTVVDLILGSGLGDVLFATPYLKFLTLAQAEEKLKNNQLYLGVALFDAEVTDTASAVVYKQSPSPSHVQNLRLGALIDIWLTNDYTKIVNDSLEFKNSRFDGDSLQGYFEADTIR